MNESHEVFALRSPAELREYRAARAAEQAAVRLAVLRTQQIAAAKGVRLPAMRRSAA